MERYVIVIPADEEQKARLVRCDDGDTCKLETLQELPFNERATDLYQYRYMSGIVGTAVLMAAREDELIGFAKPVCETICSEWNLTLEEASEECRCQTFSPD